MKIYDVAVVGVGGIGSAALLAAADQGLSAIGLEQYGAAHDRGSSHGQTRIIRTAYFEHPSYVPMAQKSITAWRSMESRVGKSLMQQTGLLQMGPPDSAVIQGVLNSARLHDLPLFEYDRSELSERWPQFQIPDGYRAVFEESAGFLRVEHCVASMIRLAKESGAEFAAGTPVATWRVESDGLICLETPRGAYRAKKAVFAAGPWSGQVLAPLKLSLQVVRKQQHWFHFYRPEFHYRSGFCCFLLDGPQGCFYGFPQVDSSGVKIAEHSGGSAVAVPEQVDRNLEPGELQRVEQFAMETFSMPRPLLSRFSVCLYTRSPDEHFIVDRMPEFPQIAFVAGLSGHGFKFAPVLGQHLIGMLNDSPLPECEFLRLSRFATSTRS